LEIRITVEVAPLSEDKNSLDDATHGIRKATEELFTSLKNHGLKFNFLDAVCKFCHAEFGHAQSQEGFPWDVEFVCSKTDCQIKYLHEISTTAKKDGSS